MTIGLPERRPGEVLTATHVNELTAIARKSIQSHSNSFAMARAGQAIPFPPFYQRRAIIVAEDYDLGEVNGIHGIYEFRFRYYPLVEESDSDESSDSSPSSGSEVHESLSPWVTDTEDHTQFLDAREDGGSLSEGERLVVFFDVQRGIWMPVNAHGDELIAKSITAISKGGSGLFDIYDGTSPLLVEKTGERKTAYMRIGAIKAGKWAYLKKFNTWWEAKPWEC